MSPGKAAAQAGHAFTDALLANLHTDLGQAYAGLQPGTKVTLDGGSEADMLRLFDELEAAGLNPQLIIDSGHVEAPSFDGSPILTAIGVGPLLKADRPRGLKRLRMWTGGPASLSTKDLAA